MRPGDVITVFIWSEILSLCVLGIAGYMIYRATLAANSDGCAGWVCASIGTLFLLALFQSALVDTVFDMLRGAPNL